MASRISPKVPRAATRVHRTTSTSTTTTHGNRNGNSQTTTSTTTSIPGSTTTTNDSKQEALLLEVSVLQAVLRRNRQSHQRTKYYQRVAMALRALQRSSLSPSCTAPSVLDLYDTGTQTLQELTEWHATVLPQRQRQAVFWKIADVTDTAMPNSPDAEWRHRIRDYADTVLTALPGVLERCEYAAVALWTEVARGFFLPVVTVMLGALARIHALLEHTGLHALGTLRDLHTRYTIAFPPTATDSFTTTTSSATLEWDEVRWEQVRQTCMTGMQTRRQGSRLYGNGSSVDLVRQRFGIAATGTMPKPPAPSASQVEFGIDHGDGGDIDKHIDEANLDLGERVRADEAALLQATLPPTQRTTDSFVAESGKDSITNTNHDAVMPIPADMARAELDTNMAMVESLKKERAQVEENKKRKSKAHRQKKKIKKQKGDFFDELFG
uniref:Nucleolus and neural progenitor protein-like N-terminal domain-containing protein n=1 Tax=Phaeodactylum tricornutum TaxID=2850 RepID=A0A8J9X0Q1_PHATR